MESTSSPDHGRQSRGLARFWPVHGTSAPEQRQSDEAEAASDFASSPPAGPLVAGSSPAGSSATETSATGSLAGESLAGGPVAGSRPTGEQPQVDAIRPAARAGETHMVALGSRRLPESVDSGRPPGQAGLPAADPEREVRAVEPGPRHGGPPIPTALPLPPSRSPFAAMGPGPDAGADGIRPASSPFGPGSPFAPASRFGLRPAQGSAGSGPPGPRDADAPGSAVPRASGRVESGGPVADRFDARRPDAEDPDRDSNTPESRAAPAAAPGAAAPDKDGNERKGDGADEADRTGDHDGWRARGSHRTTTGWAYVPTSGIPTLATSTPVPGGPATDGAGPGASAAGSPPPGTDAAGGAPAPGDRRNRDEGPQIAMPRRSTTLDDAEQPRPRVGRRAAPETTDETSETGGDTGRAGSDGDDGRGDAEENRDARALAGAADRSADAEANDEAAAVGAGQDAAQTTVGSGDAQAKPDAPMRPGDVDETLIAFWDDKTIERFRGEWHEVKADFVDDPVAAMTRAHDLITEAVDDLTEALLAERDQLDPLRTTSTPDTESMRMAMRGYREFLDRILAL